MTCALLTIGTELTRGELHDTNSGYLAEQLTSRGYHVTEFCTVDDDDDRIVSAILRLSKNHKAVLCTGGLGPTTDDRTSACAAAALNVPLVRDDEAHTKLVRSLKRRGRTVTAASEKQADFPEGASVLPNDNGTAPGFSVAVTGCRFFFMPGVPAEMRLMFENAVVPQLPPAEHKTVCLRLRTFGMPEVEVNDLLVGMEDDHLTLGYRASYSEIEVKVLAHAQATETESQLRERAQQALRSIRERLGNVVYAEGTTPLPQAIGELLVSQGKTLGVAESCTGGLVSELITSQPGASEYFVGGVCSYANSVKENLLGVDPQALIEQGAVSEPVARQMAEGALRSLGADIALSFTGIAGPDGGSTRKPVGLVHWAVSTQAGTEAHQRVFRGTRAQIQRRAALSGLWSVREELLRAQLHRAQFL